MVKNKEKEKATDDLYEAVANYVKVHGGLVVVAGGVKIIQEPADLQYNWTIGIRCTGRCPTLFAPDKSGDSTAEPALPAAFRK